MVPFAPRLEALKQAPGKGLLKVPCLLGLPPLHQTRVARMEPSGCRRKSFSHQMCHFSRKVQKWQTVHAPDFLEQVFCLWPKSFVTAVVSPAKRFLPCWTLDVSCGKHPCPLIKVLKTMCSKGLSKLSKDPKYNLGCNSHSTVQLNPYYPANSLTSVRGGGLKGQPVAWAG